MIEQLKVLPLWSKFELWYHMQDFRVPQSDNLWPPIMSFEHDYSFEFQKGVFEKFLGSINYHILKESSGREASIKYCLSIRYEPQYLFQAKTFEEVLLWAFNNIKI